MASHPDGDRAEDNIFSMTDVNSFCLSLFCFVVAMYFVPFGVTTPRVAKQSAYALSFFCRRPGSGPGDAVTARKCTATGSVVSQRMPNFGRASYNFGAALR
ncbi:putative transmembrane protein [Toxoplasma gondii TgCatPRC2]|uniref:Transmembrane protein n=5 Tax=Toxoplasma gondii TaxID=5811 RepID=A0A125YQ05_TOXGV|nr:hypothetical protein TGME49_314487 [Toxoplasma gondii ME49]ESS35219.1 putative transmembrane protein [Toxoplasma gondii VEG]KFG37644.1 putative transmembrane protein [Toxoplasma gondii GAB2-2007-GAL-DOM2]KYF40101.1 hypothetical protein TGARI_314487 [Toxoplasma gondii ARI]KYK65359.1 putative transmembrane protein [Toxoplasma gondii TgCatPRC2]EPT25818.1 hypothetical protein TGME49_314487 [Toxoplasma gondii ME49]|eukprot:XP_018635370.1 hypothetical protein TGME49_314487 [Toxoplasma gondii ME49]